MKKDLIKNIGKGFLASVIVPTTILASLAAFNFLHFHNANYTIGSKKSNDENEWNYW